MVMQISDRFGAIATKEAIQKLQANMQGLSRMRSSADRAEPLLHAGQRVAHHLHGPGVVFQVNIHDLGKPYHVLFDNGHVHCFNNEAAAQLLLAPKVGIPFSMHEPLSMPHARSCVERNGP